MEQRQGQAPVSDAAAKVGDVAGDLAGRSEKLVQDKMDQVKPVLQDLQESAAAAMEKVADLAQRASTVGVQAADAIQHVARDVGNQVGQAAASAFQQARVQANPSVDTLQNSR
jgi:prophage DNA circulation protein